MPGGSIIVHQSAQSGEDSEALAFDSEIERPQSCDIVTLRCVPRDHALIDRGLLRHLYDIDLTDNLVLREDVQVRLRAYGFVSIVKVKLGIKQMGLH